jgi:hypothetical protein
MAMDPATGSTQQQLLCARRYRLQESAPNENGSWEAVWGVPGGHSEVTPDSMRLDALNIPIYRFSF